MSDECCAVQIAVTKLSVSSCNLDFFTFTAAAFFSRGSRRDTASTASAAPDATVSAVRVMALKLSFNHVMHAAGFVRATDSGGKSASAARKRVSNSRAGNS